jgi:hypothetical protein
MVGKESESYRPRRALPHEQHADGPSGSSAAAHGESQHSERPGVGDGGTGGASAASTAGPTRGGGRRNRTALLVAAVAAVVVLGLVVGYALFRPGEQGVDPGNQAPTSTGGSISASGDVGSAVLLTDESMLSASAAKAIDRSRTWKVALTQKGLDSDSPQAACVGGEPAEGQPAPEQTMLRLLSSSGKNAPGVLHQADAYTTVEEAAQAFALTSKALGGCTAAQTWIHSGLVVSGVGDQSTAVVLRVTDEAVPEYRSVMLSRTGRTVNTIDVAKKQQIVSHSGMLNAVAAVTDIQCDTSGGACAEKQSIRLGPPPVGGDQPGFLATADLPPVGDAATPWVGDVPAKPNPDFTGTGCETTDFSRVRSATSATSRTYLLEDTVGVFGLDEIVLTMDSGKAANALAGTLKKDLTTCKERKLTARVGGMRNVAGTGADSARISGWAATVTQSTSAKKRSTFQVGVTVVGKKVVYVFLSADLDRDLNMSAGEWNVVTVRAAQRATQVS